MGICFVMQPFDNEVYDKRYEDVFAPAIIAAGLEPYRVDLDPGASILIEEIQSRIRKSDLCLAEITTDNPNVWFELGYAIASSKDPRSKLRGFQEPSSHSSNCTYLGLF
jgi:hypothetical protein